jgi:hypothetical protein
VEAGGAPSGVGVVGVLGDSVTGSSPAAGAAMISTIAETTMKS